MKNLFSVEGKVALVTGGSRGIGYMIAQGFVENGVKTYISARKAEACDAAAKELSKLGTCISLPADVGRVDEINRLPTQLPPPQPTPHSAPPTAIAAGIRNIAETRLPVRSEMLPMIEGLIASPRM